ncbi:DUF2442 domain-containing protein [Laspinema sp. A4]|uniref:DUF2442 domain-containing protein n=1 Tax=Laspinema sp. D2d TaxID=2953686 RepID=UPI0021BB62BF|nr:DUF2442 domain-containing protein [Laspinema sp. D2d]MCT7986076.1 DUF2442 domain-containing protein [Laspinema sp. D2d]
MMPYFIQIVTPEANYHLHILYSNGTVIGIDFSPFIERGGVVYRLSDTAFFSQIKCSKDGRFIEWPGEINFCADALWFQAHPDDKPFIASSSAASKAL